MYLEYAIGMVENRKRIIETDRAWNIINEARKKKHMLYFSYYQYDEEIVEHLRIFKTTSTYRGRYYMKNLVFDIDNHKNKLSPEAYRSMILGFCEDLMEEWDVHEDLIRVSFSGRGYHVIIPDIFGFTPSNRMPREVKATIEKYFPQVDTMPMIATGLIRAAYTINPKTNMYKVPFTYLEFRNLSIDQVNQISLRGDFRSVIKLNGSDLSYSDRIVRIKDMRRATDSDEGMDVAVCQQKMFLANNQTQRHAKMLRMISGRKRGGLSQMETEILMQEWIPRQAKGEREITPYEVARCVNDLYKKHYPFTCNDPIMKEFCDPKCKFYKYKNYSFEVHTSETAEKDLVKWLGSKEYREITFDLDKVFGLDGQSFNVYPGDFVVIWGDTGIGKSTIAQNIAIGLSHMPVLYLTLEYGRVRMVRRFVQMTYNMSKKDILDHYGKNPDETRTDRIQHIDIVDTAPLLSGVEKLITDSGAKVIIIDTIGDIEVESKGDKLIPIVRTLKGILQAMQHIIICVHHLSKHAAEDDKGRPKRLTLHSGLGASIVEHKSSVLIGVERVSSDKDDPIRIIRTLKASDESPFEIKREFHHKTFSFRPAD
jgi:nucleoside-triphosphatase THEP1